MIIRFQVQNQAKAKYQKRTHFFKNEYDLSQIESAIMSFLTFLIKNERVKNLISESNYL